MTGEITLTGQVLPIGGLKEKSLAAQRAGVTHVIAPKLNEADLDDFPESLLSDVRFTFVERIDQVLEEALDAPKSRRSRPARPRAVQGERAATLSVHRGYPAGCPRVWFACNGRRFEESHGIKEEEGRQGWRRRDRRRPGRAV
jgi:hypothetical protein